MAYNINFYVYGNCAYGHLKLFFENPWLTDFFRVLKFQFSIWLQHSKSIFLQFSVDRDRLDDKHLVPSSCPLCCVQLYENIPNRSVSDNTCTSVLYVIHNLPCTCYIWHEPIRSIPYLIYLSLMLLYVCIDVLVLHRLYLPCILVYALRLPYSVC